MSRFVAAGTNEEPVERDDEWLKAQEQIEATRRRKEEESRQDSGKSLYETLQANKAAKQEAFEESIRLKNQFRSLDEDEVEFLDSVLESTRAKEDAVRKETAEQLEIFRKQREEAEKAARLQDAGDGGLQREDESWATTFKKRKRGGEKEPKGLKLRKSSSTAETTDVASTAVSASKSPEQVQSPPSITKSTTNSLTEKEKQQSPTVTPAASATSPTSASRAGGLLGLGDYSSDEED